MQRIEFFFAVTKIHRLASKEFNKQLSCIETTQGLAIFLLHLDLVGEGASQREVAASMEVEQPTLVELVSRLENQCLVERKPYPGDRRKTAIFLTDNGKDLLSKIKIIYESTYQKLFGDIEDAHLDQGEQLLEKIRCTSKL